MILPDSQEHKGNAPEPTEANGRMFVLPFRGEFGIKLLRHVCRVHAIEHKHKVILCEEGDESLYPSAKEIVTCDRNIDDMRRDNPASDHDFIKRLVSQLISERLHPGDSIVWPGFEGPTAYFVPKPFSEVLSTIQPDVVICPRRRAYGSSKNWPHWLVLIKELFRLGVRNIVAAGGPENSVREIESLVQCSWAMPRNLDCTLAWMNRAKVVLSTDSGLAHLAVWCGKQLLLISHEDGIIAPGVVTDDAGTILRSHYWKINTSQYASENHLNSPITILPWSWHDPLNVAENVARALGQ